MTAKNSKFSALNCVIFLFRPIEMQNKYNEVVECEFHDVGDPKSFFHTYSQFTVPLTVIGREHCTLRLSPNSKMFFPTFNVILRV